MNNETSIIITTLMSGIQSAIFVAAFFVAFRRTSLAGFRLLFLASAANLGLSLLSLIVITILARMVEPSVVGYVAVGRQILSLALWAVAIVGGLLVLRSHLSRSQIREPDPQNAYKSSQINALPAASHSLIEHSNP